MGTTKPYLVVQHKRWPALSDSLMSWTDWMLVANAPGFTCKSSVFNTRVREETAERVHVWESVRLCCRRSATVLNNCSTQRAPRLVYASDPTVTAQQVFSQYIQNLADVTNIESIESEKEKKTGKTRNIFQSATEDDVENRKNAGYINNYVIEKSTTFFLRPAEKKPSDLFLQKSEDVTDDEEYEINNFELIIFCPYCGTKIVSSEDEPDTDEENNVDDRDEYDDTPPKVDKVAFRMAYEAIPDTSKLRLSTGTIVEDVLFEFAKDMDYEHHAHSYIVDYDDEDIKTLFDEEEWKELTKDPIGIPSIPHEIAKELTKYGKKTLKELRAVVMAPYLKEKEEYDVNKHCEQEWIQMALRTLCNLYENMDAPLIRSQYEDWFTEEPWSKGKYTYCTRKLTGRRIDGIIYTVDKLFEVGAIEGARSYSGASDQKYLLETFKMPKTLRDMYADLMRAVDYDDQKASKIQVIGILHLGLWIQFARLWRVGGGSNSFGGLIIEVNTKLDGKD
ncbi:35659_t:CDS:2 [Gigaspora margarita]|uniref:35659_t:CDS:1 n=1 Tax=Gigaspora margarita TaxID=4874 RepID=A0ABN7V396_GIGMA|nr:35659_t:CDS:2 [Gigaspora margarita]